MAVTWGSITGTLLTRTRIPVLPSLSEHALFSQSSKSGTMEILKGISASDLASAVRYANQMLNEFCVDGDISFCASVALLARGYTSRDLTFPVESSVFYTETVLGLDLEFVDKSLLDSNWLDAIAFVAERDGRLHFFDEEMRARTRGAERSYEMAKSIFDMADKLNLRGSEVVSQSTLSRYLTIFGHGDDAVLKIRISDHGHRQDNCLFNLRLGDCLEIVFERMREMSSAQSAEVVPASAFRPSDTGRIA